MSPAALIKSPRSQAQLPRKFRARAPDLRSGGRLESFVYLSQRAFRVTNVNSRFQETGPPERAFIKLHPLPRAADRGSREPRARLPLEVVEAESPLSSGMPTRTLD
jgi:hypothetical protein